MYIGTSKVLRSEAENGGKAGAAYVTRTRDPIITNKGYPRQTAVFSPNYALISPTCAVFVRVSLASGVHMYIGPRSRANATPALSTTRRNRAMDHFNITPEMGEGKAAVPTAVSGISENRNCPSRGRFSHERRAAA